MPGCTRLELREFSTPIDEERQRSVRWAKEASDSRRSEHFHRTSPSSSFAESRFFSFSTKVVR
jgi:hypothetical protein